ncbi:antibiotic biosynthesis monooxygenase, partial [Halomonas alkaliantarctica]
LSVQNSLQREGRVQIGHDHRNDRSRSPEYAAEPGCLVFEVVQCTMNLYRFDVYEEFIDRDAFERHQARVKSSAWGKVSANIERHYSQQSAG